MDLIKRDAEVPQRLGGANTHNIYTLVPGNTDLGALRTEINTDNRHCRLGEKGGSRGR